MFSLFSKKQKEECSLFCLTETGPQVEKSWGKVKRSQRIMKILESFMSDWISGPVKKIWVQIDANMIGSSHELSSRYFLFFFEQKPQTIFEDFSWEEENVKYSFDQAPTYERIDLEQILTNSDLPKCFNMKFGGFHELTPNHAIEKTRSDPKTQFPIVSEFVSENVKDFVKQAEEEEKTSDLQVIINNVSLGPPNFSTQTPQVSAKHDDIEDFWSSDYKQNPKKHVRTDDGSKHINLV